MLYKQEFLNIYERKENKELVELLDLLVNPFEKKFNKDLSQFTTEEVSEFNQKIRNNEKHKDILSLIMTYIKLVKELSIVKCEWEEVIDKKEIGK